MTSNTILINNIKNFYNEDSIKKLASKMQLSYDILLNWSSGRSSPNLRHLNTIAYDMNIEVSQLLIENNSFSSSTPLWRDDLNLSFQNNLGKYRLEKNIHESTFTHDVENKYNMTYRTFLRYANGKYKKVNLNTVDRLCQILSIEAYKLLESEKLK